MKLLLSAPDSTPILFARYNVCMYSTSQKFGHTYSFRVFLYLYYFLHCRIIVKTSKLCNNTWNHVVTKKSVKQIKIYFIFEILQSSHPLPWWQLCTLLAFSQPASPGMLFQQSWRSSHICWALVGCFSFTLRSNSSQTISIGLRSGDCGGQVIWCSTPSLSFLVK